MQLAAVPPTISDTLTLDPRNPAFYQDPYSFYAQWHRSAAAHGPVFYWDHYKCWVFGGMETVNALFRSKKLGRVVEPYDGQSTSRWQRRPLHIQDFYKAEEHSLLELEPPEHTRLRKLINKAFLSRQIERLAPSIEMRCKRLISGVRPGEPVDLIAEFAEPLAVSTIADMLGIDAKVGPRLLDWSHQMIRMYLDGRSTEDEVRANAAAVEFRDWLRAVITNKRDRHRANDLLGELIQVSEGDSSLSEDEIISTAILLLNAGHEATVHAIGNGATHLLGVEPEERKNWLQDTDLFTEEVLRIAPPLHLFFRYVLEEMNICGMSFQRGDRIGLHIGMANHDPRCVAEPQRFLPGRSRVKNTAFGAGIHFCIGHTLARLELSIAFPLLAALPGIRLIERPRFKDAYHFHGYEQVLVAWDPLTESATP